MIWRRDTGPLAAAVASGADPSFALLVADHMADGAAVVRSRDGLILYTNPSWDDMLGHDRGTLLGQAISTVIAATDEVPERRAREISAALRSAGIWRGSVKTVRKGGQQFWCDTSVTRFADPAHGSVWVIVQRDASRRVAFETRRDEAAELFRAVFEESPTPSLVVNENLVIREVNESFCSLFGGGSRDVVGRSVRDLTNLDDTALNAELLAAAFAEGGPVPATGLRLTRARGHVIDVDIRVRVLAGQAAGTPLALVTVTPCETEP